MAANKWTDLVLEPGPPHPGPLPALPRLPSREGAEGLGLPLLCGASRRLPPPQESKQLGGKEGAASPFCGGGLTQLK